MSDQKLTPEQIAGFEARAAAGERPALEWEKRFDGRLILREMHTLMIQHTPEDSDAGGYLSIYGLGVRATRFHSYLAAQLAAEHLLREATAPLHSVNDPYEIGFWRENAEKFEQCAAVLFDASPDETDGWAREDTAAKIKALIEKRDAEVAALRAWKSDVEEAHRVVMEEKTHADEIHCTCVPPLRSRIAALEAALAEAVSELMNIANVDMSKWDPDERASFREWAQSRARFTLKNLEEARTRLDSARAAEKGAQGGEGNG